MDNLGLATDGWVPAFPGQRPPFVEGNTAAVRHGARSERAVAPLARQIVAEVLGDPALAYLQAPRFAASLEAWARAEARVRLLTAWLEREAPDGVGAYKRTRGALDELHRAETRAASERAALGLTPLAAARLGRDSAAGAVDTARLMAELHRQEQERLTGQVDGTVAQ